MGKVSIIMPVYNAEEFLERAIDSVINQTFENFELICVNDGSKDRSLEILNEFAAKDSRIKVITQENAGISSARNTGLKHASGEYLMFIDNDDFYEPDMCECMVNAMAEHDVDFAVCNYNAVMDSEDYSHGWHNLKKFGLIDVRPETINNIHILVWDKIFKKELCDKYSITFPDGCMHEDLCFCYKYFSVAQKAFGINKKLYNYVIRAQSGSEIIFNKEKFDVWYSLMNVLEFLRKNNLIHAHIKCFYEMLIKKSQWKWKILSEEHKNSAVDLIMKMFNEDELTLLNSRLVFVNALKTNDKKLVRDLLDNNMRVTPLDRIFSVKKGLTHKVVHVLGLKFRFREAV